MKGMKHERRYHSPLSYTEVSNITGSVFLLFRVNELFDIYDNVGKDESH